MAAVVSVDTQTLLLERYEVGGSRVRRTHSCTMDQLAEVIPAVIHAFRRVEIFRAMPDNRFSIEPPPRPTNPPASAGRAYERLAA